MGLFSNLFGKPKTVQVTFIDVTTGTTIGTSNMPPNQLPETFEVATTMHLDNEDWTVVEAVPKHSKEFIEIGHLSLKLKKVEALDPNNLLYTIPTIANELPEKTDTSPYSDFVYSMHEDDWRQNEFLQQSARTLIDIELQKIKEIKTYHQKEVGDAMVAFASCHVRDSIGMPDLKVALADLQAKLGPSTMGGLKISGQYAEDGFALKTEATTYFGTIENGTITQLCIGEFSEASPNEFRKIIDSFQLVLVGWVNCQVID